MHSYLKSIGFSKLNKDELKQLIEVAEEKSQYMDVSLSSEDGSQFVELKYMLTDTFGLCLRGSYNEEDEFELDYYFPICCSKNASEHRSMEIIKQSDKNNYQVICDEYNLGVNLIFTLQNMSEYMNLMPLEPERTATQVYLNALCSTGTILLPCLKTEKKSKKLKVKKEKRNSLLEAAREGDEKAIESLTLDDMDIYALLSQRIKREDIYTIVSSFFMPYGIENDKYTVLGEISKVRKTKNQITMENVYIMDIVTNDLPITLCINENDLLGVPEVGRRFKGDLWLQGTVVF